MRKKFRPDEALNYYLQPVATKISPLWGFLFYKTLH